MSLRQRWPILNTFLKFRAPEKTNYAQKISPEAINFAGSRVIAML